MIGASYLAVPIYQMICTQTGLDGTPKTSIGKLYRLKIGHKFEPESMTPLTDSKPIKVKFTSSISDQMKWKFVPGIQSF